MRIKHSARITAIANVAADELGLKPSRAGWTIRAEQAERLARILDLQERTTTHKPKRGVQAIAGRVRVARAVRATEVELERPIREIYADMIKIVSSMQEALTENPPAWVESKVDRYGRGLTVMSSPWANYPCPIHCTYDISEEGLNRLKEDVNCIIYYAIA